jgi:inhibitor of Bruton tyrosine kinase
MGFEEEIQRCQGMLFVFLAPFMLLMTIQDVALGADGSIIICTESGHVFGRIRTAGKAFKFQRIPYLQRIIRVCANSTGALGALKVEPTLQQVQITGNLIAADLARVQPYFSSNMEPKDIELLEDSNEETWAEEQGDPDEQADSPSIVKDIQELKRLCRVLLTHKTARKSGREDGPFSIDESRMGDLHGADVLIHVHSDSVSHPTIPAHRIVLASRSPALADVLAGKRMLKHKLRDVSVKFSFLRQTPSTQAPARPQVPWTRPTHISVMGAHPLTVLILLVYMYADEVLSLWDWRVANSLGAYMTPLSFSAGRVKMELQACAEVLELDSLAKTLEGAFKREVKGTLGRDILAVCPASRTTTSSIDGREEMGEKRNCSTTFETYNPLKQDVILALADKEVPCHSTILRARSPLFEAFFDAEVWTVNRWSIGGTVRVELEHMRWNVAKYVLMFLYGADREMFDMLGELFVFQVVPLKSTC